MLGAADLHYELAGKVRGMGSGGIGLVHRLAQEIGLGDAIDKLPIYADLGVPEIWRYDGERLRVVCLQAGHTYAEQPQSSIFPFLPLTEIDRFLAERNATDETTWIRSFRAWVKKLRTT
jgi:hypothetical protein